MKKRSIRFRLTVWYAVLLSVGLALFGGLIWLSLRNRLYSEIDRDLDERASRFERYFRTETTAVPRAQLSDELEEFCQALPAADFIELHGNAGFAFRYPAPAPEPAAGLRIRTRQFTVNGEAFEIGTGAPVGGVVHTLDLLRLLLLSLSPVVIAIACLGGAWLSARALKPVHDIAEAARTIGIENISERLPSPETDDELARLTEVLNSMLGKLEAAVKTLSQFAADASHELRTPLAVIHTTAELALRRERTPDSYRDSLREVAAGAGRMTKLVEDLLLLARREANAGIPFTPIDLRPLLQDVCLELRALAETRRIRLRASLGDAPAAVLGNQPELHRLFLALLDNAVKFSHDGGEVIVAVQVSATIVSVTFEDFGAGIPEADLPHIFKRFYRAGAGRGGSGHGLGLALADTIARAHGAAIEVRTAEGSGTMFRVVFPARGPGGVTSSLNRSPHVVLLGNEQES